MKKKKQPSGSFKGRKHSKDASETLKFSQTAHLIHSALKRPGNPSVAQAPEPVGQTTVHNSASCELVAIFWAGNQSNRMK